MKKHAIIAFGLLLTLAIACAVPKSAPDTAKSDLQIAEEAVECMIEKEPENSLGLAFLGGKDNFALIMEQTMTRRQIIKLRNEECNASTATTTALTPYATYTPIPKSPPYAAFTPGLTPTPTPNPTPVPPEARFLKIQYDATHTMNNRQDRLKLECGSFDGIKAGTEWSRTHNLRNHPDTVIDADGKIARVAHIEFAESFKCGEGPFWTTTVRTELVETGEPPNLTGFTLELRDKEGGLVTTKQADCDPCDGTINVVFTWQDRPQDLFEEPAILLLYDNFTKGAQPTPTPEPAFLLGEKSATISINPEDWPIAHYYDVAWRDYDWKGYKYRRSTEP